MLERALRGGRIASSASRRRPRESSAWLERAIEVSIRSKEPFFRPAEACSSQLTLKLGLPPISAPVKVHRIGADRGVGKGTVRLSYHNKHHPNTLPLRSRPWDDDALHPVAVETVDSLESTFAQEPDRGSVGTRIDCTTCVDDARTLGSCPGDPAGFG